VVRFLASLGMTEGGRGNGKEVRGNRQEAIVNTKRGRGT